ncbi:MAG: ribosome-associated translation inhibitor RaiA [Candidatus Polarisedimenticolaceae bacterium]|nr:ribosome-associated translation inhibitor RaiA [Candidatus Polarisedimenticolaceae bacterium]
MQISVTGHHIDITDSLRNYVEGKFERLERHFDNVTNVHVILGVEKLRKKAEATIKISGAKVFADAVDEDMYAAIDALTDKLDRQILKHKEKFKNHRIGENRRTLDQAAIEP